MASEGWSDRDEKDFTLVLERELDKIHEFQKEKVRHSCGIWVSLPLTLAHPRRTNYPIGFGKRRKQLKS